MLELNFLIWKEIMHLWNKCFASLILINFCSFSHSSPEIEEIPDGNADFCIMLPSIISCSCMKSLFEKVVQSLEGLECDILNVFTKNLKKFNRMHFFEWFWKNISDYIPKIRLLLQILFFFFQNNYIDFKNIITSKKKHLPWETGSLQITIINLRWHKMFSLNMIQFYLATILSFVIESLSFSGYQVLLHVYSNQLCLMCVTFTHYVLRKQKIIQNKIESFLTRKFCVIVKWDLWSEGTLFLKVNEFFEVMIFLKSM